MKKVFLLLLLLAAFAGCINREDTSLSVSQSEIEFPVNGGELFVNISSDGDWDCQYSENWIHVRLLPNGIRLIADTNEQENERTAIVQLLSDGKVKGAITVKQSGLFLEVEEPSVTLSYIGEEKTLSVSCNVAWDVVGSDEWLVARKDVDKLVIDVARNYKMEDRVGTITLEAGNSSRTIEIRQSAAPWHESFEMVHVDAGTFYMGAQKKTTDGVNYDASAYIIESPVHKVSIGNFYIGKFEVTQAQWVAAMGTNPSTIIGEQFPVTNVSWEQVQDFIEVLNRNSGKHYRLPTEAEWEFAAKGGTKSQGYKYSGSLVLGACAWYYSNSGATLHEVGSKNANELGIFDMSGNVSEWCSDWFEAYSAAVLTNPQGASSGNVKVNRGGSWATPAVNCRNSYRQTAFPNEATHDLGFRLVLVAE